MNDPGQAPRLEIARCLDAAEVDHRPAEVVDEGGHLGLGLLVVAEGQRASRGEELGVSQWVPIGGWLERVGPAGGRLEAGEGIGGELGRPDFGALALPLNTIARLRPPSLAP